MLFQMEVSSTKHTAREAEGRVQMGPVSLLYTRARSAEGQARVTKCPVLGPTGPLAPTELAAQRAASKHDPLTRAP